MRVALASAARGAFSRASPRSLSVVAFDESAQPLDALVAAHPRVLAYYTAAWCGPCRAIGPKFTALAAATAGVTFVKVDIDSNEATASKATISSVPTFISFVDGKEAARFSGANAESLAAAAAKLALK